MNIMKEQGKEKQWKNKQNLKSPVFPPHIQDKSNQTGERNDSRWLNKYIKDLHRNQFKSEWHNTEIFISFP